MPPIALKTKKSIGCVLERGEPYYNTCEKLISQRGQRSGRGKSRSIA